MNNLFKPEHKFVDLFPSILSVLRINSYFAFLCFECFPVPLNSLYNIFYPIFIIVMCRSIRVSTLLCCHYRKFQGSINLIGLFDLIHNDDVQS